MCRTRALRALRHSVVAVALTLSIAGCGGGEAPAMPDVVGSALDVAKSDLKRAGVTQDVEVIGGGLFGVVDEGNWLVCEQLPEPGAPVTEQPRLTVDRSCGGEEAQPLQEATVEPSPEVTPSEEPPVEEPTPEETPSADPTNAEPFPTPAIAADVADTTATAVIDMVNNSDCGPVGTQYRFKAELSVPDVWSVGATGELTVYFIEPGGDPNNDFFVLTDESTAAGWSGGTVVDMTVANVERTVQGDTSDCWFQLVAATPGA
jgi:hypothetical protein